MSGKALMARLDKIQPNEPRRLCLIAGQGESEMEIYRRAAALGYPVMVVPGTCETSQEWERIFGRPA
jgi:DUF1009 family protein